ncbi:cytochrome P450 [Streptomyces sp. NPDC055400]
MGVGLRHARQDIEYLHEEEPDRCPDQQSSCFRGCILRVVRLAGGRDRVAADGPTPAPRTALGCRGPLESPQRAQRSSPASRVLRTATCDTMLSGSTVCAGDAVTLWLPSVNQGESLFGGGDTIRLDRRPKRPLAFGAGVHFCLGAPLARMLLSVWFDELGRGVGEIKVIGSPQRVASYDLRGYSSLMVELARRPIRLPDVLLR